MCLLQEKEVSVEVFRYSKLNRLEELNRNCPAYKAEYKPILLFLV